MNFRLGKANPAGEEDSKSGRWITRRFAFYYGFILGLFREDCSASGYISYARAPKISSMSRTSLFTPV